MKFSKSYNPNCRKAYPAKRHSDAYLEDRKKELCAALAKCETEAEREMVIKAHNIALKP